MSGVSLSASSTLMDLVNLQNNSIASLSFPAGHCVSKAEFPVGLFINGKYSPSANRETIDVYAPATGKVIARVPAGQASDVDRAVDAAQAAYETVWGERCSGRERGRLLMKLADLFDEHADALASIESMVSRAADQNESDATH